MIIIILSLISEVHARLLASSLGWILIPLNFLLSSNDFSSHIQSFLISLKE